MSKPSYELRASPHVRDSFDKRFANHSKLRSTGVAPGHRRDREVQTRCPRWPHDAWAGQHAVLGTTT